MLGYGYEYFGGTNKNLIKLFPHYLKAFYSKIILYLHQDNYLQLNDILNKYSKNTKVMLKTYWECTEVLSPF